MSPRYQKQPSLISSDFFKSAVNFWILLALGLSLTINGYLLRQVPTDGQTSTAATPAPSDNPSGAEPSPTPIVIDQKTHAFVTSFFELVFLYQLPDSGESPITITPIADWGAQLGTTVEYQSIKTQRVVIKLYNRAAFGGDMKFIPFLGKPADQYKEEPFPNPPQLPLDTVQPFVFRQKTPEVSEPRIVARYPHPNGKFVVEVTAASIVDLVEAHRSDLSLATLRFLSASHQPSLSRWQGLQGSGFTALYPSEWYKEDKTLRFSSSGIQGQIRFRTPDTFPKEGNSDQRVRAYLQKVQEADQDITGFQLTKKNHPIPSQEQFEIVVQRKVKVSREDQVERWVAVVAKDNAVVVEASIHPVFMTTFDRILETVHVVH